MATAARVGLASAIVGQLIIAAAEVIWPSNRDLGDVLFSVSPILTGAGLVTAGVAIIRAGVWARPSRFLPLTLGLYTILVLIPVMIASGGPPAPLALWTIGGWDMLWFVLSASLLRFTPAPFRATRHAVKRRSMPFDAVGSCLAAFSAPGCSHALPSPSRRGRGRSTAGVVLLAQATARVDGDLELRAIQRTEEAPGQR